MNSRIEAVAAAASRVRELGTLALVAILPLVFNPYSFDAFERPKVLFFRATVGVLALSFLLERASASDPRKPRGSSALDGLVVLYAAAHVLATIVSIDPGLSFWGASDGHGTLTLLGLVGLYFILSRSRQTRDERARLLDAVLLSTIPLALYGLLQYVGLDPLPWLTDSVSPVLATMGRSNFLGAYMAMAVPLTFFRIASSSSRSPVRLWTILLLQASIVALSQARAAWLALVGGAVVFTALLDRGMERRRFLALTVSFLALGILLFTPLSGGDPPSLRVDGARSAPSFSEIRAHTVGSRLSIWRCTLSLLPDRWLLGYGPEAFARVFASRCPVAPPGWIVDDPHNLFLDQLFAAGVTGAIAFAILIVFFFRSLPAPDARNRNERALRAALLGSGTAFLVQAQFNPDAIALTLLFWVVLAIAARSREVTPRLRTRYNISNSTFE